MSDYPHLAQNDVAALLDLSRAALDAVSPEFGVVGSRLLAEHGPQQWPVEWHLPWWLAGDLGLPEPVWRSLTVCNLLGLGYARLQDQLVEGAGLPADALLAAACHEAALARLTELFSGTPLFWQQRSAAMAQWLHSFQQDDAARQQPFERWQGEDLLRLAWRGAPLKITASGACLLAGQQALIAPLSAALDHLLTAQVLLDHVDDWREDLAGGHFNVFVAYASRLPQDAGHVEANSRQVLALLMMGDPGGYFALVQRHAAQAAALAAGAGCSRLASFARYFQRQAQLDCQQLVDAARSHLAGAVNRVLVP